MRSPGRLRTLAGAVGGAACLLSLLAAMAAPLRAQDPARGYEEGFFDLSLARVGRRIGVTSLVDGTGRVLIPLRAVVEHAGIVATWSADSAVLEWPPDVWRTVLRYADRSVETGGRVDVIPQPEWVWSGPDVFLSASALTRVLGSPVEIDFAQLTLIMHPNPDFPAIRRLDIDLRRRVDQRAYGALPTAFGADVPYPPRTGGFVASWGISATEARANRQAAFRAAAGAAAWGGALEAGGTIGFGNTIPTTLDDRFLRWTRGFPDDPWIRQLQVGTIFAEGPAGRRILGLGITNAPFNTPRLYGEAVIEPAVPSGWEYEVYQGDYLIGVGSRDQPGGIRTPLNYGNTPVRVRMIGPAGQEQTRDLVYVVRPEMVPARSWRYGIGAGACADPGCEDYSWAELRYGMFARLTAGAGIDRITLDDDATRWRPYVLATGNPIQNLGAELQFQPGALFRSALQLQTANAASWSGSYAWLEPAGEENVLAGWNAQISASAPIAVFGRRFMTVRALLRGTERNRVDLWQVTAATALRRIYTSIEYEHGFQTRDLLTTRAFASWPTLHQAPLRDLAASAAVGFSRLGPDLLELGASARPIPTLTISTAVRTRRGSKPTFILGFATRLDAGFAQARASHASEGSSLFVSADGAIAHDRDFGAVMLPFEGIGRAGVAGVVYDDLDGDGVQSTADVPVRDAVISIGTMRVRSGQDGSFHAWLIEPYEALPVALDSLSIPFDRVAARPLTVVRPSPNLFARVDIPIVRTREVAGRVSSSGSLNVGGVGIELLDLSGNVIATTRTFRDGEYYVPRIRPGRYRVRIASASLAALGAQGTEVELEVPPSGEEVVRAGELGIRQ